MRQGAEVTLAVGMMIVFILLRPAEIPAQELWGLRLGTWGGEVQLGYGSDRQQARTEGGVTSDFAHQRYREQLTIRNQGSYFVDPRLVTGNLALTFGLFQDQERSDGSLNSRQGKLIGYATDFTFLAEKPYSGTLYANRTQNFATQPFGGHTDLTYENHGAVLRLREDSILRDWGVPYFSSNLRVYQENITESTTSLGQTFQRNELRNVLSVDGHKGFETSDLDLRYEFTDHNDAAFPLGAFQTQMASLSYSLDFGPTLNRRWDSRLNYYSRTGLSPTTFLTADEHVRIDHFKNLSTDYRYLLTRIDTQAGTTTTHNGIFHLQHRLYRNLTTNALLSGLRQELPDGVVTGYAGQLDFNYRRGLPRDGRLFASAGGRYQLNDNDLGASQINVIDAAFSAPSPLGGGAGFLLEQPFVIASTIVVVDTRGGARLPTTLGMDYDIVPEGNLIRIVPLPASLVIQPGDPLAVSYSYRVDRSLKYTTASWWLRSGVDFRWIAFSAGHEQTDQTALSGGSSQFLENRRNDTAQLDLRGAWKMAEGQVGAAYQRYNATFLAYTRQRFNQHASYRPGNNFALAFNAEESHTDFTLPLRQSDTRSAQLTTTWLAPGGWWTTALLGRRVYKDSLSPTETVNEAKAQARKTYGKLMINSAFTRGDRVRGAFETDFWRVDVTITRRF